MRIGINLASRPYQDEGRFYRLWGAALALTILITALMIIAGVRHYVSSRKDWASARATEERLVNLRKEEAQAQQILAEPRNRGTRDSSQFLNNAILRKSFCWTRLMEDMEKVMPPGLRVVSITPTVDQHSGFVLRLQVQGEKRESTIELLRNMEKSQHFRSSELIGESLIAANRGAAATGVKSEIKTSYAPAESLVGSE